MHRQAPKTPLEALMRKHDVSANALAELVRIPQPTISRIASGATKEPKEATLQRLADYFGVTVAHLRGAKAGAVSEPPAGPGYAALSEEALAVARRWMKLSPGRRAEFSEAIFWAAFFERKFPAYKIGKPKSENYPAWETHIERAWEQTLRQGQLPLDSPTAKKDST